MRISLCGIKHAGKTTAAKALSELAGTAFADTDDFICLQFLTETGRGKTVREIFAELGETSFRRLEIRALHTLLKKENIQILALGGGLLSNPFLTDSDRKNLGFLCWLDVPDETAFERMLKEGLPPFLAKEKDPFARFKEQNRERRGLFEKYASIRIAADRKTPEETARLIFHAWKENASNE